MIRRNWKKVALLFVLGIALGTGPVFLLRYLYGIPSLMSFLAVALFLAICDCLYAWNVERTTRAEGPGVWNSIVGRQGTVLSGPTGSKVGSVRVSGEIWKARCRKTTTLLPGQKVRVTARRGLVLNVEPVGPKDTSGTCGIEEAVF